MSMSNPLRSIICLAAIVLVSFCVTCSASAAEQPGWSRDDAAHLLRRAGFGATPQQIDRTYALGREEAVEYLINGKLPDGVEAPFAHVDLEPFKMTDQGLDQRQGPEKIFEVQKFRIWWIDRMVRTDRPLEEKMTLFWHGLFTSGLRESKIPRWLIDQNLLFHKEAIGNYKRLTREIIYDPAMLKYLNNDENVRGKPNENLARELMELFTMGEGNGYTEQDIPQVARALTGLTPRPPRLGGGGSIMRPTMHDIGQKTIFGHTGRFGPDDVVNLIFDRPEPANYLAQRLWTFFAGPEAGEQDLAPIAAALREHNWDVAPALRVMFNSRAFYSDKNRHAIIKSPIELEVGTLRLLEEPPEPRILFAATNAAKVMGEELLQPPNVKGWPGGEHWITSSAIYTRYNVASAMAAGTYGFFGGGLGMLRGKEANGNKALPAGSGQAPSAGSGQAAGAESSATVGKATDAGQQVTSAPPEESKKDLKRQNKQAINQQERAKVRQEMAALPPLPPPAALVVTRKLFPQLVGKDATADQVVDAAVARFLQQPLPADKKKVLAEALGDDSIRLGQPTSDRRVRQMIGLLMSTPEYQTE
jgi:uncharacterized protein (DUF1800 family)